MFLKRNGWLENMRKEKESIKNDESSLQKQQIYLPE